MLKAAMFQAVHEPWPVVYLITEGEGGCVYTGVTRVPSTINFAEQIIEAICAQEKVGDPRLLNFYDLQTHLGYSRLADGEFKFDEVLFSYDVCGKRVQAAGFKEILRYTEVIEAFRPYISDSGIEPRQI